MARLSRAERTAIWTERFDRYSMSDQTVAEFCRTEGCSVPSFYQWRRRLIGARANGTSSRRKSGGDNKTDADKPASSQFAELVVTGHQAAQAHLPNGVSISLGRDAKIVAAIVDRLLAYEPATATSGSRSASQSSC